MKRIKILVFITTWILLLKPENIYCQPSDSLSFSALNRPKTLFLLDDIYIMGGAGFSGIYYSNHFRRLSGAPGFSFGIERYFSLKGISILNAGINISQRNFMLKTNDDPININNTFLDIPVMVAFELPVLKQLDFRFLLGAYGSYRLHSKIHGDYKFALSENPELFHYQTTDFNNFDFGWQFGLSMEYKNILVRVRSYSGFVKLDRKDQGMLSTFNLEVGYFLFRTFKPK